MAFSAIYGWEFETVGSNTNGGGYKSDAGTTDYSQQASPQLTVTDAVANGTTTITSSTGGFTAAMVGNGVYLSNITGWREIATYVSSNEITVDSTVTTGTGITANVGGALALMTDAIMELATAGNTYWIKNDGTYTLTSVINVAKDGTSTATMKVRGYNTTHGDNPTGTDRPLIAGGANALAFDNFWDVRNIRYTGTSGYFVIDNDGIVENVSVATSGTTYGIHNATSSRIINCEVSGAATGIRTSYGAVVGCYIHDCTTYGILVSSPTGNRGVFGCIIDTCPTGIHLSFATDAMISGNTIYNSTVVGLNNGTLITQVIINNDINSCLVGITGTNYQTNYIDYNNFNNNGTDVTGVVKGGFATATDPAYTSAAGGNFANTLPATASPITTFPGGLTANALVPGAVQPSSGGGGGSCAKPMSNIFNMGASI